MHDLTITEIGIMKDGKALMWKRYGKEQEGRDSFLLCGALSVLNSIHEELFKEELTFTVGKFRAIAFARAAEGFSCYCLLKNEGGRVEKRIKKTVLPLLKKILSSFSERVRSCTIEEISGYVDFEGVIETIMNEKAVRGR